MQKVVLASRKLIHILPNDQTVYKSFTVSRYMQEELKNDPVASVDFLYQLAKSEFPQNVWVQQILNTVSNTLECDSADLYELEQLLIIINTELHDQGHDYLIETIREIYSQLDPTKNPEKSFDFKSLQKTYERVQGSVKQSNSQIIKSQVDQSFSLNQQAAQANSKILEEVQLQPPLEKQSDLSQAPKNVMEQIPAHQLEFSVNKQNEFDYSLITTGRKSPPKENERQIMSPKIDRIIQDIVTPYFPIPSPTPQIEYMPSPPPDNYNAIEMENRPQDPPAYNQIDSATFTPVNLNLQNEEQQAQAQLQANWQQPQEEMNIEQPYQGEEVYEEPEIYAKQAEFEDDPEVIELRKQLKQLTMEIQVIPRSANNVIFFPHMPEVDPILGKQKYLELKAQQNQKRLPQKLPPPQTILQQPEPIQPISIEKNQSSQAASDPRFDPIVINDNSPPQFEIQRFQYQENEEEQLQSKPKDPQQLVQNLMVRQQQSEARMDDILIDKELEYSKKKQTAAVMNPPTQQVRPQTQKERVSEKGQKEKEREQREQNLHQKSQSFTQSHNRPQNSPRSQQSLNKSVIEQPALFNPPILTQPLQTPKVQPKKSQEKPSQDSMQIEKPQSQSLFTTPMATNLQPDSDAFLPVKMTDEIISMLAKKYARLEKYLEQYPELNTQILYTKVDNFELYQDLGTQKHERIRSGLIKIYQIMEKILLPHQLVRYSFNHDTYNPEPQVIIEYFPKINRKKDKEKSMQIFASKTETFGFMKCELFSIMILLKSFFLRSSFEQRDSYLFSEVVEVVKRKMLDLVQIKEFRDKFSKEYQSSKAEFADQILI